MHQRTNGNTGIGGLKVIWCWMVPFLRIRVLGLHLVIQGLQASVLGHRQLFPPSRPMQEPLFAERALVADQNTINKYIILTRYFGFPFIKYRDSCIFFFFFLLLLCDAFWFWLCCTRVQPRLATLRKLLDVPFGHLKVWVRQVK